MITTSQKKEANLNLPKENFHLQPQRVFKMIHDDPDELTIWKTQGPKIIPWPKPYFDRIQEMTDRELKLRATHLHEEKLKRIETRTKELQGMPSKKKKRRKNKNAQDPH